MIKLKDILVEAYGTEGAAADIMILKSSLSPQTLKMLQTDLKKALTNPAMLKNKFVSDKLKDLLNTLGDSHSGASSTDVGSSSTTVSTGFGMA